MVNALQHDESFKDMQRVFSGAAAETDIACKALSNPGWPNSQPGFLFGPVCQRKAHVLNEVANTGSSPVRSTNRPDVGLKHPLRTRASGRTSLLSGPRNTGTNIRSRRKSALCGYECKRLAANQSTDSYFLPDDPQGRGILNHAQR